MSNIGYAIFKKTSNFVIDSNGMFEDLKLNSAIDSVISNSIESQEVGQKSLCFKRISSEIGNTQSKDAYVVILIESVLKNNKVFILGSAICFKQFQVNEKKIIDGVKYLLSQLQRNIYSDYDVEDKDLGVILPSTNKDFKIFKDKKLVHNSVKTYKNGYNLISFSNTDAEKYLHHFSTNQVLLNLEHLFLVSSVATFNVLEDSNDSFIKINLETLKRPKENLKKRIIPPINNIEDVNEIKNKLTTVTTELNKEKNDKKLYKILSIVLFCFSIFLVLMFTVNRSDRASGEITDSTIYPIEERLYISNNAYNVNVRSTPSFTAAKDNLKDVLSDGDEVFLLGFDKETLWAKISYNDSDEIGYVSNRFISKNITKDRIEPVNKTAKIGWAYYGTALYKFPQEAGNENPEKILILLDEDDVVFVKNKDLKMNWFSVRVKKNNKIYNGFLQGNDFKYQ